MSCESISALRRQAVATLMGVDEPTSYQVSAWKERHEIVAPDGRPVDSMQICQLMFAWYDHAEKPGRVELFHGGFQWSDGGNIGPMWISASIGKESWDFFPPEGFDPEWT